MKLCQWLLVSLLKAYVTHIFSVSAEPILSIMKSEWGSYYCTLTNDSMNSALSWNYTHEAIRSSIVFCNLTEKQDCTFTDKFEKWQYNSYYPLILDYRWEEIPVQKLEFHPPEMVHQIEGDEFEYSFSFKGIEIHIILCNKIVNNKYGKCYWLALGAYNNEQIYLRKCEENTIPIAPTGYNCGTNIFQKNITNVTSEISWNHFTLKKVKSVISLQKYDQEQMLLDLEFKLKPFKMKYVYVRHKGEGGFMKVHKVNAWSTNSENAVAKINISTVKPATCFAMYIKACKKCVLHIQLPSLNPTTNTLLDRETIGKEEWEELIFDGYSAINSMVVTIKPKLIESDTETRDSDLFWSISEIVRNCSGTAIPWVKGNSEGCCSALKYPAKGMCTSSLNIYPATAQGSNCTTSEIGKNCIPFQPIFGSNASRPKKICQIIDNEIICSCSAGLQGKDCDTECITGKYGHNCKNQCGKCKYDQCNAIEGTCGTSGCEDNFEGTTCTKAKLPILKTAPVVENLSYYMATINVNWEYDGLHSPKWFKIQHRLKDASQNWNQSSKYEYKYAKGTHSISGLQSNTEYIVRVVLYTSSDETYDGRFVPAAEFKTLCANLSRELLEEDIGNTSITLSLVRDRNEICPLSEFALLLYEGKMLIVKPRPQHMSFYASNLKPYTNYTLQLRRNEKELMSWDVQTKEGVPEQVQDINSELIDTKVAISWKEPNKPNGAIRGYQLELFLISSPACSVWPPQSKHKQNVTDKLTVFGELQPYSEYQVNIAAYTIYLGTVTTHKFKTKPTDEPTQEEMPQLSFNQMDTLLTIDFKWDCGSIRGELWFKPEFICRSPWCLNKTQFGKEEFIHWQFSTKRTFIITGKTDYTLNMYISRNKDPIIKVVNYTTKPTKPNIVGNLTIYSKTINSIYVRWLPPYPPTGDIDAYWIQDAYDTTNERKVDRTSECTLWPGQICTTFENRPASSYIGINVYAKNVDVPEKGEVANEWTRTKEEVSKQPQNLTLEWDDYYGLKIRWHHPDVTNGPLTQFFIRINNTEMKHPYKVQTEKPQYKYEVNLLNSFDIRDFTSQTLTVSVVAANSAGNSTAVENQIHSPPKMPAFDGEPTKKNIENTNFTVYIPPVIDVAGDKGEMFIIVTDIQESLSVLRSQDPDEEKLFRKLNLAGKSWIAGRYHLTGKWVKGFDFVVGNDSVLPFSNQKKYTNRKLAMGYTYNVTIVLENIYMQYSRYRNYTFSCMVLPPETSGSIYLWLLLLIPIIVICAVLLWRNHNKVASSVVASLQQLGLPRTDVPMRPLQRENNTPTPQAIKSEPMVKPIIDDSPSEEELKFSKPVKISDLTEYVKQAIESGELEKQHGAFQRGQTKPWTYGIKSQNKSKNRYANLAAYDHTRVKLQITSKDPFSDYINANYIDGYKMRRAYIATQGPKPNTLNDFWKMIWQEKVGHIIMIANLTEGGKKKVEKYWPEINETKVFDNIKVKYVSVDVMANYEVRCLTACKDGEVRKIEQLHFLTWPDHGVPLYAQSLSPFLRKMLTIPQGKAPIVVHCSAGVGRTGSLILCDICLRMAAREGKIDAFYYLYKIREQRVNMVDNIEQYKLVHLVLLQCLVAPETGIVCDENMKDEVNTVVTKKIEEQMQYLDESAWQDEAMRASSFRSSSLVVQNKNRFQNILPDPASKIILSPYPTSDESSTYINAVSVDAFVTPSKFIVTQNPLPTTVGDFWRLVDENDITVIICLNELDFEDKTTCNFFPTPNLKTIKPVPYLEMNYVDSDVTKFHKHFKVTMSKINGEADVTINILQLNKWNNDLAHPTNPNGLFVLYDEMNRLGRRSGKILVTCHDGSNACGLFVAMCFIIDKIKMEQVCDVCLAVNTVRHSRKEFVRSREQFAFLYKCAVEYVAQFETYSNFSSNIYE